MPPGLWRTSYFVLVPYYVADASETERAYNECESERDSGTESEEHTTTDTGESEEELMPGAAILAKAFGGADKWEYTVRKRKRRDDTDDEQKKTRKKKKKKKTRVNTNKRVNTNRGASTNKRAKTDKGTEGKQEGQTTGNTNRTTTDNSKEHVGNINKER